MQINSRNMQHNVPKDPVKQCTDCFASFTNLMHILVFLTGNDYFQTCFLSNYIRIISIDLHTHMYALRSKSLAK